jgi:Holliday junction resolvase RusA-like endonuclease
MISQSITLPLAPSVNAMFGNRRGGGKGRFPMPAYKRWQVLAGWEIHLAKMTPIDGPYVLSLVLPSSMMGDVDNRIKATSDLFVKHRITPDDCHMSIGSVVRGDVANGLMMVTITGVPREQVTA